MNILLNVDPTLVRTESEFLRCVINKVTLNGDPGGRHAIHFYHPRSAEGWLESQIVYNCDENGRFVLGQSMTVGAIQRTVGAGMEYHS